MLMKSNRSVRLRLITHFAFWLVLFMFPFNASLQTESWTTALARSLIPLCLEIAVAYTNIYVLIPRFFQRKRFGIYTLCILIIIAIIPWLVNLWADEVMQRDAMLQRYLNETGITADQIPGPLRFIPPVLLTMVILFISSSYALALNFLKKEQQQLRLEKEKISAELKFLRAQINPHFFFNALNNLYAVTKVNPERTEQFVSRLSEILRYVIYDCKEDKITLEKELKSIDSYLFFQEIKDPDNIQLKVDKAIENDQLCIEPMLIIPLLENAFKHGYDIEGTSTKIRLQLNSKAGKTEVKIWNSLPANGSTPNHDPGQSGVGLENIRQRLSYCYPERHELSTQQKSHSYEVNLTLVHE